VHIIYMKKHGNKVYQSHVGTLPNLTNLKRIQHITCNAYLPIYYD